MRKFLVISIPIMTIIIFILIMLSDTYLKYSFDNEKDIPSLVDLIKKDIENEEWDEANSRAEELSNEWNIIVRRIQFSADLNEINQFNENVARLKAAIWSKDKSSALMELNEAFVHWENIGN